jgi:hypothetical protein
VYPVNIMERNAAKARATTRAFALDRARLLLQGYPQQRILRDTAERILVAVLESAADELDRQAWSGFKTGFLVGVIVSGVILAIASVLA